MDLYFYPLYHKYSLFLTVRSLTYFSRRKKKCIRFVAGNPNPQDVSENEDSVTATGTGSETVTTSNVDLQGPSSIEHVKTEPLP